MRVSLSDKGIRSCQLYYLDTTPRLHGRSLLDGDGFGQVAGLIDVLAAELLACDRSLAFTVRRSRLRRRAVSSRL